MSIKVMNAVFERYPNGGGEMLLALALADHAHDDGSRIFPSVEQLAEKTRQSVRSVQYQLRRMQECGWLILVNAGNGGRKMHSEYRISLEWIKGAEIAPIEKGANDNTNGASDDTKGCNPRQETVQPIAPPYNRHRTINEPSLVVADAPKAKACRATVLPSDFMPNETAEKMADELGLSIAAEQAAFEDHHSAKGTTFKDWQAAFRTWLRNANKFRKPAATGGYASNAPIETYAQRAARQRVEEVSPMAARKAPAAGFDAAQRFMNGGDVIDVTPRGQQQLENFGGRDAR